MKEKHYDYHFQYMLNADAYAWKFAEITLQLLVAFNGGALIAILAFLGANLEKIREPYFVIASMFCFGASFILTILACVMAYFTAVYQLATERQRDEIPEYPYIVDNEKSNEGISISNNLRTAGIAFAILSVIISLFGAGTFAKFALENITYYNAKRVSQDLVSKPVSVAVPKENTAAVSAPSNSATPSTVAK